MIEASTPQSLHQVPTAAEFITANKLRMRRLTVGGILLALLVAASWVIFGRDNIAIPLIILTCVALPMMLWRYPISALYIPLAIVCLVEVFPTHAKDSITDIVPFFENLNTILQRALNTPNVKAFPFNILEAFLVVAAFVSLIRSVYTSTAKLRAGAVMWPIVIYMVFIIMGEVNGMATGGDFKISMQEIRSQFYFLLAYLMAVNMVREIKHIRTMQWIMIICIGIKGILYTFRRYVTMAGMPLPDQGVGSHEEAFMFNMFEAYLLVLITCGINKPMRWTMLILLPLVLLGNLSTNRRAATAALIVALPILVLAAYQAFPPRRKLIFTVALCMCVAWSIYYPLFKNNDSLIGQPARAMKSHFEPDARDAASNDYRLAEEADLYATIKLNPIQGYGYGKRMLHAVHIVDISNQYQWWDILPHNNILWVWMRVGTFGFISFWAMIAAVLILACRIVRSETADIEVKSIAIFTLMAVAMLLMFGLLDLQLSNFRDMLFVGFWIGALSAAPNIKRLSGPTGNQLTPPRGGAA
jgi:hypothetical protein